MNKPKLIQAVVSKLTQEREVFLKAAEAARAEATDEQNKAENKYDTRGLEASYLARGQSQQVAELGTAIVEFEKLADRRFAHNEPIDMGAFVELQQGRDRSLYLLGPRAGGTEVQFGRDEVIIITPQSPLGSQLVGSKQGDVLKLSLPGNQDTYRVVKVE
jgi:transcription elongation GreA/GreB family factor